MIATRALPVLSIAVLALATACSSSPEDSDTESVGRAKSAVIKGKPSPASQDAVVLIVHYDEKNPYGVGQCTGTLLSPRLVLTARHCVADTDPYAACDEDGTPLAAGAVRGDHKADTLYVFTGKNRPEASMQSLNNAAGRGMKIIHDRGKNLCNHDLALLVLKEPITDAPITPIRLESEVTKGETITAVGWGVTEKTDMPETRQQRTGVKVKDVGPAKGSPPVPANEFEVGESICSGDSGGPAFSEKTGAVVGVVSRGGNAGGGGGMDQNDPAAGCINGSNLYTKVSPFKDLILGAYELAEAEPWLEGGPDPRLLKPGNACVEGTECRSSLCLADPSQANATTCAEDCSASSCPEGQACTTEGDVQVCRVPKKDNGAEDSGGMCSGAPAGPASGGFVFALAAAAVAAIRRRRRA